MPTINIHDVIPRDLASRFRGGRVGIGYDVASSVNRKANPSALTMMEYDGLAYRAQFIVRWRTDDTRVNQAILRAAVRAIPRHLRQGLSIDASNETLAARDMARLLSPDIAVHLVKGGDTIEYEGQAYKAKTLLGNLYTNLFQDNLIALPPDDWIFADHRQVVRNGSEFFAEVAPDGCHADVFDACKHALWTFKVSSGPAQIEAVDVTSSDEDDEALWQMTPLEAELSGIDISSLF